MKPSVTVIQPKSAEEKISKIRVAAYCRVSSDSADQLNSFMAQMRYYENFLSESTTETLVGIYADESITGTRMDKRDDFQRMLKDCRKGKIDRIIAKSISRFARNTKECLTVIRELNELGITVFFEKENLDTASISDELMITIMGGLAQEESVSISQNMQWSIHKRMKNGTYEVSCLPYGYNKENGNFTIDKKQAEIVQKIFKAYLGGKGLNVICDELNRMSDEIVWHKNGVKYILTNEKYIGDCLWRKKYTENNFPFRKCVNHGKVEQYYVTDDHEPIISKSDFEAVQKLLQIKSVHYGNKVHKSYPLSRKIICKNCGSIYKRRCVNNIVYWNCSKHDFKAADCESVRLEEEKIYRAFITLYNKLKINYTVIFQPVISQLQELRNKKFSSNKQYSEIMKEIAKLKEQTHVLARLKTKGFLDDSKYLEQTAELNSKIEKLNRELQKISRCDYEDDVIEKIKDVASIIESGTELMTEFDEILFESLVEKIVVKNQKELEFQLYGGLKFKEIVT